MQQIGYLEIFLKREISNQKCLYFYELREWTFTNYQCFYFDGFLFSELIEECKKKKEQLFQDNIHKLSSFMTQSAFTMHVGTQFFQEKIRTQFL